jgi:hypothetical protein
MQMMGSSTNCMRTRPPPAYNASVAQMAARMHRLGRAHSHEGVTSTYYLRDDNDDDDGNLVINLSKNLFYFNSLDYFFR